MLGQRQPEINLLKRHVFKYYPGKIIGLPRLTLMDGCIAVVPRENGCV
jgi:hypothetical protein